MTALAAASGAVSVSTGGLVSGAQGILATSNGTDAGDIVRPFTKEAKVRPYFDQLTALYRRHPQTTIIWAHAGLGRIISPVTCENIQSRFRKR